MKKYLFAVMTQVEVEAFDPSDAKDIIEDIFGNGAFGCLEVINHEVLDEEELNCE